VCVVTGTYRKPEDHTDTEIVRSSRHSKIIGNFGESLLCNWLSRSGFEVVIVDHTGMDVIAYHTKTRRRLGITVKSRTRAKGRERSSVNIFSNWESDRDRQKLRRACCAFDCEPWIAVYVETTSYADLYLVSLKQYDRKYRGSRNRALDTWKMGPGYKLKYERDREVRHIRIDFSNISWRWRKKRAQDS
jgi:hypothetical protein